MSVVTSFTSETGSLASHSLLVSMAGGRVLVYVVLVYVVLVYAVVLVWGLDVVYVELGQNATINCSGSGTNTYWQVEDQEDFIVRTFSQDATETQTPNRTKYVAAGNVLVVTNVNADDFRMYSCGVRKSGKTSIVDRILLVPDCPARCSSGSQVDQQQFQSQIWTGTWRTQVVLLSSLSLNAVLIVVVIGLVCGLGLRRNLQVVQNSPWIPDPPETLEMPQYEEIQNRPHLPTGPGPGPAGPGLAGPGPGPAGPGPGPAGPGCIYHKLQLPKSPGTRTRTLDLDS